MHASSDIGWAPAQHAIYPVCPCRDHVVGDPDWHQPGGGRQHPERHQQDRHQNLPGKKRFVTKVSYPTNVVISDGGGGEGGV